MLSYQELSQKIIAEITEHGSESPYVKFNSAQPRSPMLARQRQEDGPERKRRRVDPEQVAKAPYQFDIQRFIQDKGITMKPLQMRFTLAMSRGTVEVMVPKEVAYLREHWTTGEADEMTPEVKQELMQALINQRANFHPNDFEVVLEHFSDDELRNIHASCDEKYKGFIYQRLPLLKAHIPTRSLGREQTLSSLASAQSAYSTNSQQRELTHLVFIRDAHQRAGSSPSIGWNQARQRRMQRLARIDGLEEPNTRTALNRLMFN